VGVGASALVVDIALQGFQEPMKQMMTIFSSRCLRLASIVEDEVSRKLEGAVVLVTANEVVSKLREVETVAQVVEEVVAGVGDLIRDGRVKKLKLYTKDTQNGNTFGNTRHKPATITIRPFSIALESGHDFLHSRVWFVWRAAQPLGS